LFLFLGGFSLVRETDVESLKSLIEAEGKVVVVTGAGVSTGSGIPDFASVDSAWDAPVPRSVAISLPFFEAAPAEFWEYYKKLFAVKSLNTFSPSKAHLFLKELEEIAEVQVFTQNVDGLHSLAGSSNVVELHGNAKYLKCVSCGSEHTAADFWDVAIPVCPLCDGSLKPTVVLFGEGSEGYQQLQDAYRGVGVALFMGTSLNVAPVSNFPYYLAAYQPQFNRIYWNNVVDGPNVKYFHQVIKSDFDSL
jgi:NAD-dependent SIR2 family protein deacetylase